MPSRLRTARFAIALSLLIASISHDRDAAAADFFVENTTGTGVSETDLATASELVRLSVAELPGHKVIEDRDRAEYVLRPKLMRLGGAYIMALEKLENGKSVYSSQLKAAQIDELDKVARRLTRSVVGKVTTAEDVRVGEVTDEEAKMGAQRHPARKGYHFGFGPALLSNLNTSGIGYNVTAAYAWDVNHGMIKILGDLSVRENAFFVLAALGGSYFLNDRSSTPYVSGEFGYGGAKAHSTNLISGQSESGFVLGAGVGYQFLRTTSVNLDIGLKGSILLQQNAFGNPMAFGIRLGIFFN